MSVKSATFYTLDCDEPGCDTDLSEIADTWQYEVSTARDTAMNYDWHHEDGKDYCEAHFVGMCERCSENSRTVKERDNNKELCDSCWEVTAVEWAKEAGIEITS